MSQSNETARTERFAAKTEAIWPHLFDALRDLRYGQVTVTVQDGYIVQIERTEKRRFTQSSK